MKVPGSVIVPPLRIVMFVALSVVLQFVNVSVRLRVNELSTGDPGFPVFLTRGIPSRRDHQADAGSTVLETAREFSLFLFTAS